MKKTNPANAETPEASTASVATGQMAHTPLPWHTDPGMADDPRFYIKSLNHVVVAILDSHSSIRDEANAEYIVTACNSFPVLVALAEEIAGHLYEKQDYARCREMAREVLAKAGSGRSVSVAPESKQDLEEKDASGRNALNLQMALDHALADLRLYAVVYRINPLHGNYYLCKICNAESKESDTALTHSEGCSLRFKSRSFTKLIL